MNSGRSTRLSCPTGRPGDWRSRDRGHTAIEDAALGHEYEVVEELCDVGVGLVDGERDRAALRSNVLESGDDGDRYLRVQTTGRLVQEQTRRSCHELHPDGCPLLLAA